MRKKLLAGLATGLFMFGIVGLAEAANIVINDHFDDGVLDPAWSIYFNQATDWFFTESGTVLHVTDVATTGSGWASVNLTQYFTTPLSDFNIDFIFSWDSEGSVLAMQNVLVQAYAQAGQIAEAGYSDGWIDSGGAKYGMIGGNSIDTGPDSVTSTGSASININRTANVINITWDGESLISGIDGDLLGRVDLVFAYYVYDEAGVTSFFGNEDVDLIKVEGVYAPVPIPSAIFLLGPGIAALAGIRFRRRKGESAGELGTRE